MVDIQQDKNGWKRNVAVRLGDVEFMIKVEYWYSVQARFSDTDLYGVVHHSNYFRWLEEARIQFMEKVIGVTVNDMEDKMIRLPVIQLSGKFKKSVFARDIVDIKILFEYNGAAKLVFHYEILDKDNIVCFVGSTEHAIIRNNKLLLKMPEEIDARIKGMLNKGMGDRI